MRAHVALFATVRDGLIVHQASYDCYESLDPLRESPGPSPTKSRLAPAREDAEVSQ